MLAVYLGLRHHGVGGVIGAFLLGYVLDTFSGTLLGVHAAACTAAYVVAYLIARTLWTEDGLPAMMVVFLAALVNTIVAHGVVVLVDRAWPGWLVVLRHGLVQAVFATDWRNAVGGNLLGPRYLAPADAAEHGCTVPVQITVSGPDSQWEAIHRMHVAAIHTATRRVWLTTPYFVPGEAAMQALTSAALGGLDVRLLVPKVSDSRVVTLAARSYFDDLLAAGVRVYEYMPRLLHSKTLLIDDHLAIIGSATMRRRTSRTTASTSRVAPSATCAVSSGSSPLSTRPASSPGPGSAARSSARSASSSRRSSSASLEAASARCSRRSASRSPGSSTSSVYPTAS